MPATTPTSPPAATPALCPPDLRRCVGFWGGIAVMMGVIIGSGIFRTPPTIAQHIGSPWLILGLWAAGGLLCLAGALTYAELAAMHPASGGVYVFIREGFGKCAAFVFGWAYLVLIKPFAAGGIAFFFGESFVKLFGIGPPETAALWAKCATTAMLLGLTAVNLRGTASSAALAGVLTFIKFATLAGIVVLALVLGRFDAASLRAAAPTDADLIGALSIAAAGILWTYDGWSDVGAIAGEVRTPQRTLPRIYLAGTVAIIAIYVAVNAAYFMLVPLPEMRAAAGADASYSVAPVVVDRLLGLPEGVAPRVVFVLLLISTFGSTHASILTGARVSYAQARDGLLFRFVGHVHPRWGTPDYSLLTQLALSIAAVWLLGSFQSLAEGFVFTMWIFYGLAGAALLVLRVRRPDAERPFRCPGYPVVPAVFVLTAIGMTALSIYSDRREVDTEWLGPLPYTHTVPWLVILGAGVPVYYAWRRLFPAKRNTQAA